MEQQVLASRRFTDAAIFPDGEFELCGLRDEECLVRVRATRQGERGRAELEALRPTTRGLRLVLASQPTFALELSARDEHGERVEGLRVEADDGEGDSVTAVGNGTVVLPGLVAGEWTFEVRASGFLAITETLRLEPGSPALEFVLMQSLRVRGLVLDSRGEPVSEATVELGQELGWTQARTDAAGRFELDGRGGAVRIRARKSGHGASETLALVGQPGATLEGLVLRLRDACRLVGRVVDDQGRPVQGAWVMFGEADSGYGTESGEDGSFLFADLPPGPGSVNASDESSGARVRTTAVLGPDKTSTVELRFAPPEPVLVHGVIRRGGAPFAGGIAFLSEAGMGLASSGPDGSFETTLPLRGPWNVLIRMPRETPPVVYVLEVSVPDVDEHELLLEIETMRRVESLDELPF